MEGVHLEILPQPDDSTCGPTCLQAMYRYWGDEAPLSEIIAETPKLAEGGTLASLLGCHALARGYRAKLYSYNLNVLDPTWFREQRRSERSDADGGAVGLGGDAPVQAPPSPKPAVGAEKSLDQLRARLEAKLLAQMEAKEAPKLQIATRAYIDFLRSGGEIRMEDLTRKLIRSYLNRSIPILAGLSSTYLYQTAREYGPKADSDDVRGHPAGHFVVLCGYDRQRKEVLVADPYLTNPFAPRDNYYIVGVDRVLCAILLGTYTYDANLLIIQPSDRHKGHGGGSTDRR